MGVYISGLEMPQDGRITLQIDSTGSVYVANKFSIISEKYEKSMTATWIQPHGKLIDVDMIEYENWYLDETGENYKMVGKDDIDGMSAIIEAEGGEE